MRVFFENASIGYHDCCDLLQLRLGDDTVLNFLDCTADIYTRKWNDNGYCILYKLGAERLGSHGLPRGFMALKPMRTFAFCF